MDTEIENSNRAGLGPQGLPAPLMTLLLVAYNQERFIAESVAGALAQTYSPLEIILSDDCSTDGTYREMELVAKNYTGPHKIILNRNTVNLGIGGHFNRCLELSTGEFIIASAGDDISLPDRVRQIYRCWRSSDAINAVFSNLEKIDENGISLGPMYGAPPRFARSISDFKKNIGCWVVGASFSFEKKIFQKYGVLDPAIRQEDGCLAFRAILEGEIGYLDEMLVKYRHHGGNVSQSLDPGRRLTLQKSAYLVTKSWLDDARKSGLGDRELLWKLKLMTAKAFLVKFLLALPFLGYLYNYSRIKAKLTVNRLKVGARQ